MAIKDYIADATAIRRESEDNMKAAVYGYPKFKDRKIENVVYVSKILDIINIQYIKDDMPVMLSYNKNEVKIIIEN